MVKQVCIILAFIAVLFLMAWFTTAGLHKWRYAETAYPDAREAKLGEMETVVQDDIVFIIPKDNF